ncbi:MAG TPA: acyl-CoA dehydrogenase family protein [Trebonia sp.]|nr:acyl-CoA dehydrogenase family protein [Trebonia sp.]
MTTVDLQYSDAEQSLAGALDDLLASRAGAGALIARTEQPETADLALWKSVATGIGVAGLLVPEELGGAGASYRELAAAAERLGAHLAPVPYLGSAGVATAVALAAARSAAAEDAAAPPGGSAAARMLAAKMRALSGDNAPARAGSQSARPAATAGAAASLLRQLAAGSATAALALPASAGPGAIAPGALSSDAVASRAAFPAGARLGAPQPGDSAGGTFRLRGTIASVADALAADVLLVPAEGVPNALYLVDAAAPGVHRAPVTSLDMTRQLCDLSFDGAPARPLVTGAAAFAAVEAGLVAGAVIIAAEQLGVAQRALDMTVAYVKERRQFARPVGSFQALKHRLADLWATIAQARAAARYAAACLAAGDPDTAVAVALAKSACCDAAVAAAQECVQLHGGIGFTWEHPAHLYLKRAKAASVAFGTPGAHRAALAGLVSLPAPR